MDRRDNYTQKILTSYQRSPRGKSVAERVNAVIDIEDGMTFRAASTKYGIGTAHLQRYCKMCEVRSSRTRLTKEQLCEVVEDIRSGMDRKDVAQRWGVSERRVYRIGFAAGIRRGEK